MSKPPIKSTRSILVNRLDEIITEIYEAKHDIHMIKKATCCGICERNAGIAVDLLGEVNSKLHDLSKAHVKISQPDFNNQILLHKSLRR